MAAVEAGPETVAGVLKNFDGVCIANCNAPNQTVVSGTRALVEQVVEHFTANGTAARRIPVACAFHSPVVASAQRLLAEFLEGVRAAEARFPVYSNTTAAPYPQEANAVRELLVEHLVRPVEFVREIEAMYAAGARNFVEAGPRGVLTNLVDQILGERPKLAIVSNQRGKPGVTQLLHLLGQLAANGCDVRLERLFRDRSDRVLNLDQLERECREKPLSAATWMVNGARAIPLHDAGKKNEEERTAAPATAVRKPATKSGQAPAVQARNGKSAAAAPSPTPPPVSTQPPAAVVPVAGEGAAEGMAQFQQVMTRYLETQKTVMLGFLGSVGSGAG